MSIIKTSKEEKKKDNKRGKIVENDITKIKFNDF